jgi:hypothetical protein
VVHNLIHRVYPNPEKFWITIETENLLGGVNFVSDGINEYLSIPFEDINRNPFDYEDSATRYSVKLIRYIVDSDISKYMSLDGIEELVLCRVNNPDMFEFPEQRYAIYFPGTNALAVGEHVPVDKRVFETNQIFVVLLLKQ